MGEFADDYVDSHIDGWYDDEDDDDGPRRYIPRVTTYSTVMGTLARQTEKAWQVTNADGSEWYPKSKCRIVHPTSWKIGDKVEMDVPDWLLEAKEEQAMGAAMLEVVDGKQSA